MKKKQVKKTYKIKNGKLIFNFVTLGCILLSVCLLSIGYAAITAMDLNIDVNISANQYQGIFISDVHYSSDIGADLVNSKIIDYTDTLLHSDIYLSQTDGNSSITYTVTIFNNSDALKQFKGVEYSEEFYSNNEIGFRLDGLAEGDLIPKGEGKTFNLTFFYNNPSSITNNELDSYLNFVFDYYFDVENDVDIVIREEGEYVFGGVDASNPVTIQDISNIHFNVINGSSKPIVGIKVDIIYSTTSGSSQSGKINLQDDAGNLLQPAQTITFLGKQTNANVNPAPVFNITIPVGEHVEVAFDQQSVNNGKVSISGVIITPIF